MANIKEITKNNKNNKILNKSKNQNSKNSHEEMKK